MEESDTYLHYTTQIATVNRLTGPKGPRPYEQDPKGLWRPLGSGLTFSSKAESEDQGLFPEQGSSVPEQQGLFETSLFPAGVEKHEFTT